MPGFDLVVTEGALDLVLARKLLAELGIPSESTRFRDLQGGATFWSNAARYDQAARHGLRVLGICDLESDPCAGALLAHHLSRPPALTFVLRIAVRMLESWLLADAQSLSAFLRVSVARLPENPDGEIHPKRALVSVARNSTSRAVREDLVPAVGACGITGGNYVGRMSQFIEHHWSPERARIRSASLDRALRAVERAFP